MATAVHIGPYQPPELVAAVEAAGGRVSPFAAAEAVVWLDPVPESLPELPGAVRWVQLPGAGAEQWLERARRGRGVAFTTARGVYALPVAEHALALLLAGIRRLAVSIRAHEWRPVRGETLEGSVVAIVGAGGIGAALTELLLPLRAEVIAVTRSGREVPGAARSLPSSRLGEVWPAADHFVVAAPLTAETRHLVGAPQLAAMKPHSWVVNVGRGGLIDTDALVEALRAERIGGAALDVTDPEPLPDGHPLWSEPRAIVTPHAGPALRVHFLLLGRRVHDNLTRLRAGEPLITPLDVDEGY
jgi:D-3-phosphoglycerate dehydrogenase